MDVSYTYVAQTHLMQTSFLALGDDVFNVLDGEASYSHVVYAGEAPALLQERWSGCQHRSGSICGAQTHLCLQPAVTVPAKQGLIAS